MRIKVLHNDYARFEAIRLALIEKNIAAEIVGGTLAADNLPTLINGTLPDLVIVDDATEKSLDAVEALYLRSPGIDTVLISSDTTTAFLLRAMRAGVREVVPASGDKALLQEALARILLKRAKFAPPAATDGKVLAFLSCKGGSGATFLAANFAYALASEYGRRVALIDLNLQFGDAAIFVSEIRPPSDLAELSQQILRLDASLLAASMLEAAPNFFVLAAPEDPAHAVDVRPEHVEAIVRLARAHYDFVVIDVPRSLDAVSLLALDVADLIFPILQLTLPFVRDGKRLLTVFRSLDYPRAKIRLLVNRHEKGGELSVQDLERAVDGRVFLTIPNSYAAAAASVNHGVPIVKSSRNNPISRALIEMAREFVPVEAAGTGGRWLSRIFSRGGAA
ncbi:MAG: AAA family ATPase [Rhodocyclaceae bacterium]